MPVEELDAATVRFCGDSGDGMQVVGAQLTRTSAHMGNAVSSLPDFPAEIRAPVGTLAGVSGFQVHFSSQPLAVPGDQLDALVTMNPAALAAHIKDLKPGGLLLVNSDAFTPDECAKAGFTANPLDDDSLRGFRLLTVALDQSNADAVAALKLTPREAARCRNFFALGLVCWLFDRELEPIRKWIHAKFSANPAAQKGNVKALNAGYTYGESGRLFPSRFRVRAAALPAGTYRHLTGTDAIVLGLHAAAARANRMLVFTAAPMTPASDLLNAMQTTLGAMSAAVQADDESAAAGMALGAAFGGAIGATAASGPGLCQMAETIGLAVMTELPLVVIDVQRGGPSTGLPTKTEQTDLLQALFGRNGECPVPVLAPASPSDCFTIAYEAVRIACRYMTPVLVLTDVLLAAGAEPWRIPDPATLPPITLPEAPAAALPYQRDERLSRPWAAAGDPGHEHRIGGLEKEDVTGNVSYDPLNHERMCQFRAAKVAGIVADVPDLVVDGPERGDLLVVGWGSTYGVIAAAVQAARNLGRSVAHAHLRHLHPLPRNTGDLLRRFRRVLVPELNHGQLRRLLRAEFLLDIAGLNKLQGRPFLVSEITAAIEGEVAKT